MSETDREDDNDPESPKQTKKSLRQEAVEYLKFFVPVMVCFFFCKGTMAEARYIPSSSMEPTLQIQDRVFVDKLSYKTYGRKIQRGDILVFYPPEIETGMKDPALPILNQIPFMPERPPAFIKRVVGVPGDRIEIKKNVGIFVNDKKIAEPSDIEAPKYALAQLRDIRGQSMKGEDIAPFENSKDSIVVPEHHFFMMGDNHNHSADSHVWGFLDDKRVIGRVFFRLPIGDWLKSFS